MKPLFDAMQKDKAELENKIQEMLREFELKYDTEMVWAIQWVRSAGSYTQKKKIIKLKVVIKL